MPARQFTGALRPCRRVSCREARMDDVSSRRMGKAQRTHRSRCVGQLSRERLPSPQPLPAGERLQSCGDGGYRATRRGRGRDANRRGFGLKRPRRMNGAAKPIKLALHRLRRVRIAPRRGNTAGRRIRARQMGVAALHPSWRCAARRRRRTAELRGPVLQRADAPISCSRRGAGSTSCMTQRM